MGVMHDPRMTAAEHHSWNVQGTTRLLDACASYGVPKVSCSRPRTSTARARTTRSS